MPAPLVIFLGECNACGFISKSTLSVEERGIWPEVVILNNLSLKAEPLDFNSNNSLLHATMNNNRSYGWELFLAQQARAGLWGTNPVYLVKGGQGGTTSASFADNVNNFYTIFLMRVRAMLNQMGPAAAVLWYQQGANETEPGPYKKNVIKLFADIRRDLWTFPIVMTKHLPISEHLNPLVEEIAGECPQVSWIDTVEANQTCPNPQHWDRRGMEITADALRLASHP